MEIRNMPKEDQAFARAAIRAGWTLERRGSHVMWRDTAGRAVTTSNCTPGKGRGTSNLRARLRRAGLEV